MDYPEKTTALTINQFGDVPDLNEIPVPPLGRDEVLIRVRAASINAFDWKLADGMFRETFSFRFPLTLGRDYAGGVEAIGADVTRVAVGDEVFGYFAGREWHRGSFAHHLWVRESECFIPKPAGLDFATAACLPLSGVVALRCVEGVAPEKDDVVLVTGAPGGVGSYVVQLAAARGAHVIATGGQEDEEYLTGLGASEVLSPGDSLISEIGRRYPAGIAGVAGITALVDLVNYQEMFMRHADLLTPGGRAASLHRGVDEGALAARGLTGVNVGSMPDAGLLERLGELAALGELRAPIRRTYPLEEAAEGLAALKNEHARGKLVVTI